MKTKIGILGCGNISAAYFSNCAKLDPIEIVACCDLDLTRAKKRAEEFSIPKACTVSEMLADPDIEIIINLTIPKAHAEVNTQILKAGKHAYVEKPFALNRKEGQPVLALAKKKGLYVGCAPDTVLGGGIQTSRKAVVDGLIGEPVAAVANMACGGHETWHPDPEFYYQVGGGPLLDMGPYYLTALVTILGPVKRVSGMARASFPERLITSQPKNGKKIPVETPTHIISTLEFKSGLLATVTMSFDVKAHKLPMIEIYGSKGSLRVPDPNCFNGQPELWAGESTNKEWKSLDLTHSDKIGRGYGVADMAMAIRSKRPHRASGELAFHILDIMQSILESAEKGSSITLKTSVEQPEALPTGLGDYGVPK